MSDHLHQEWDDQQRKAREAVGSLGRVPADPDFRAGLRDRFVARVMEDGDQAGRQPRPADQPDTGTGTKPLGRPFAWGRVLVPLAAAAVLAVVLIGMNPLPGPRVLQVAGEGVVQVDGRDFSAEDEAGIAEALQPGSRVTLEGDVSLDLVYPGTLAMRLEAGSEFLLPRRPGRWFARQVEAELPLGEVSIRTGPELAGGRLNVTTPEGEILITGTLVSVYRNPELICVCLFEGSASVSTAEADLGAIPPRKRWVVFNDGRQPALLDIEPGHEAHMLDFDRRWRDTLGVE